MPFKTFREFIKLETSAGVVLFGAAVLALIISNSPWDVYYQAIFNLPLTIQLGGLKVEKPFLLWVNDGFMTIFFLLIGLEIKREMISGELNSLKKAALPFIAALGGMAVPAIVYIGINYHDLVAMRGWAIPTATDIAFSLGILALLGSCIPPALKIFLTALAIFDDLGAIIIIAVFYTAHISIPMLLTAGALIIVLFLLNRFHIVKFGPYFVVGVLLWFCVLKSGVHATMTGILLALAIPLQDLDDPEVSPSRDLEHKLHPWVAFGILPLFAFANAGVDFGASSLHILLSPIPLGIALGLFLGKQFGIWGATMFAVKSGLARMPHGASSASIYGIALVAGVGFTMSLFIGTLAFGHAGIEYPAQVRMGVMVGSLVAGLMGYFVLRISCRKHGALEAS